MEKTKVIVYRKEFYDKLKQVTHIFNKNKCYLQLPVEFIVKKGKPIEFFCICNEKLIYNTIIYYLDNNLIDDYSYRFSLYDYEVLLDSLKTLIDIEISITIDNDNLVFNTINGDNLFKVFIHKNNTYELPKLINSSDDDFVIKINALDLFNISKLSVFSSTDELKKSMQTMCFEKSDKNTINVITTDNHWLSVAEISVIYNNINFTESPILQIKPFAEDIVKFLKTEKFNKDNTYLIYNSSYSISDGAEKKCIVIENLKTGTIFATNEYEGNFVDYKNILQSNNISNIFCHVSDSENLLRAINLILPFCENTSRNALYKTQLFCRDNKLILDYENKETGNIYTQSISVTNCREISTWINLKKFKTCVEMMNFDLNKKEIKTGNTVNSFSLSQDTITSPLYFIRKNLSVFLMPIFNNTI